MDIVFNIPDKMPPGLALIEAITCLNESCLWKADYSNVYVQDIDALETELIELRRVEGELEVVRAIEFPDIKEAARRALLAVAEDLWDEARGTVKPFESSRLYEQLKAWRLG